MSSRTWAGSSAEASAKLFEPLAITARAYATAYLAGDGTALGGSTGGGKLPTIELGTVTTAEGLPPSPVGAARALGAMPPALRSRVTRIRVMLDGTLELRLRGATIVRFGTPDDAARKVEAIRRVLAWAEREGSAIRSLSVVAPTAPAATLVR